MFYVKKAHGLVRNKMKKILLTLSILVTLSNADYALFQSQTQEIGTPVKTEEVFFGKYRDFGKKLSEATNDGLKRALFGGIVGGLSTAGLGLISGMINNFAMSSQLDEKYLRVLRIEDKNGKVAFKKTMFIGAKKGKEYTDEEILNIMKRGK
jgi:hypothetical protein